MKNVKFLMIAFVLISTLIGCNSAFKTQLAEAETLLNDGDFSQAKQLYDNLLEEKPDNEEVKHILSLLTDYELMKDEIASLNWDDALKTANSLIKNESIPTSLKDDILENISHIEEEIELIDQANNQLDEVSSLISNEQVDEAKALLKEIDQVELPDEIKNLINKNHKQLAKIEEEIAERERIAEEKRIKEEKEQARATHFANLRDTYLNKISQVEATVEQMYREFEGTSSSEMRIISRETFLKWDDLLNELWGVLQNELSPDVFESLKKEQIEWVKQKEARVDEIISPDGGSLIWVDADDYEQEVTEERIYYLIDNFLK